MSTDDSQPNKPIRKKKINPAPGTPQSQPHPLKRSVKKRLRKDLAKQGLAPASIREAAREYKRRGWQPIPLLPGKKVTFDKGWTHSHITEDEIDERFAPDANIGVLMGTPSMQMVDVDLDWVRGLPFADEFFPPTPAIFGRAGKPRSHRLYICDIQKTQRLEFSTKPTAGKDDSGDKEEAEQPQKKEKSKPFVEIRADKGQTMFPPSVHPSRERVRWDEDGTPAKVDADTLLQCARDYASACLIGDLWPGEGARNEAAMAVCGCLVKWGLPEERAKRIVRTAALIADDEEVEQRVAVWDSTKAKVEAGEHVVAEGVARELFQPRAVMQLRRWLGAKGGASDDPDGEEDTQGKRSQADKVLELAADFELFTTPGDRSDGWCSVMVEGGRETFRLRSRECERLLHARYWVEHAKPLNSTAFDAALNVLQARATHEGVIEEVALRVAGREGVIYIDLGDTQRHVVEITERGWDVVRSCPVRFQRPNGHLPLPMPIRGGTLDLIRGFVNVEEDDWILLLSWLIGSFHPKGPYPILALNGGQGSAKSTTTRVLKRLTDPNKAELRSAPRTPQDLAVAAQHDRVLTFDNLSRVSEQLSDALCMMSTGGSYFARRLFSDDEQVLLDARRPLLLNGIPDFATQPDLIDRSIHLVLPSIQKGARRVEDLFWFEFEKEQPRILGAIFDALSAVLREVPRIVLDDPPRMADFSKWGVALEMHLGLAPGTFLQAYEENRNSTARDALEESGFVEPLRIVLAQMDGHFRGSATDLFNILQASMHPKIMQARNKHGWPRAANQFSGMLRRLSQSFDKVGIRYEVGRDSSRMRNKFIELELTQPLHLLKKSDGARSQSSADQFPVKQVVFRVKPHVKKKLSGAQKPPLKKKYLPKKDPPPTQPDADAEEEG